MGKQITFTFTFTFTFFLRRTYSSAKNKKAQDRWREEEEKLLVQLWAEKHNFAQHGVMFCSEILFSSATVAFRTIFVFFSDFKSDLSRTNLKLSSSATWPAIEKRARSRN